MEERIVVVTFPVSLYTIASSPVNFQLMTNLIVFMPEGGKVHKILNRVGNSVYPLIQLEYILLNLFKSEGWVLIHIALPEVYNQFKSFNLVCKVFESI